MLPPSDPVYNYFGPVCFGPYHSLAFSIDTDNWASGQDVKPMIKKQPEDTEEHGLYWGVEGVVWHLHKMAATFRGNRASGRTFMWMPCYEGGLKLGDTPCFVDPTFGDKYYPLLHVDRPRADSAADDKQLPEDFEVQFVYQGDIN
ncbi:hypothetical protein N7540_002189 [Penicillium herquei]|nr:hypothetical protein N7540_002189 [Penicillium herquei]